MARNYVRRYRRQAPVTFFYIKKRDGSYLLDEDAFPAVWSKRDRLAFRTKESAERAIVRNFISPAAARELCGIHVVRGG